MKFVDRHTVDMDKASTQRMKKAGNGWTDDNRRMLDSIRKHGMPAPEFDVDKARNNSDETAFILTDGRTIKSLLSVPRSEFDVDKFVKETMDRIVKSDLDQELADYLYNLHRKRIADDDSLVVIVDDEINDGFGRDE